MPRGSESPECLGVPPPEGPPPGRTALSLTTMEPDWISSPPYRAYGTMLSIPPGSLVLVTGASGYAAAHIVSAFLDQGYNVRGTVRTAAQGDYLSSIFKDKSARFSYILVPDMIKEGAYDDAVAGAAAVIHTASPFHFDADEPEEIIRPALEGVANLLKSVQEHGSNVQRVVLTSSIATVEDPPLRPPATRTEKGWNEYSVQQVEQLGREASGVLKYQASKVLAERAFWRFFDTPQSFDGVVINPALILGPLIHQCPSPQKLNTSVGFFWQWMNGEKSEADFGQVGDWIDVRDCALAHVRACQVDKAGGERFICCAGLYSSNDYAAAIHRTCPDLSGIPAGQAMSHEAMAQKEVACDGSKCAAILGVEYTPLEQTLGDMASDLRRRFMT